MGTLNFVLLFYSLFQSLLVKAVFNNLSSEDLIGKSKNSSQKQNIVIPEMTSEHSEANLSHSLLFLGRDHGKGQYKTLKI